MRTGALTTLASYIVLQLMFFALGWLDVGNEGSGTTRAIVSGVLALVAFFLGGAAAGASALWRRANDGMVNGVVAWAVTVVALLGLALIGGGALLGSLADTATQFVDLRLAGVDVAEAARTAQQSAGWTALGLGLSMVAAALGGSVGAKLWPGRGGSRRSQEGGPRDRPRLAGPTRGMGGARGSAAGDYREQGFAAQVVATSGSVDVPEFGGYCGRGLPQLR